MKCSNQVRQIGLAVHNFENNFKALPYNDGLPLATAGRGRRSHPALYPLAAAACGLGSTAE